MTLAKRFRGVIRRLGDAFTSTAGAGLGVFATLSPAEAGRYLSDADPASVGRPIRLAYVPHDDATATGQSVTWQGQTLNVANTVDLRYRGATVLRVLVLTS